MKAPLEVLSLFPELNKELVTLLRRLSPDDWQRQTVAKKWKVKDVASHLLDGNLRRISLYRDGYSLPDPPAIQSNEDLVNYLNTLNGDWVNATRRFSPAIITELLVMTNGIVYELFCQLDPFASSVYAVSWAGETQSFNWFDIAREYTERWLHQQQIRDALGDEGIMSRELYHPFLSIFIYAWPVACAGLDAETGTILKATITGSGGGEWFLQKEENRWELVTTARQPVAAETIIEGSVAWKLFSKSVRKEEIEGSYTIRGNHLFGEKILEMVSVMA